jgi:Thioredoxin
VSRVRQEKREEAQKAKKPTNKASERTKTLKQKSVIQIGPVALIATAVAIASVLVGIGIGHVAGSPGQPLRTLEVKEVSSLLGGIPQRGDTLGQAKAPITLQIFGDLESADVRTFVVWLLPNIISEWVRTNVVKIQYRSFMTASSPYTNVFVSQQVAALAAGSQDRLWNFIEVFYHEQGREHTRYVTKAYLDHIARQVPGLDLSEWEDDRENTQLAKQVVEDDYAARAIRFPDAPLFLIGRTGGSLTPWPGYRLYEEPGLKPGFIKRPAHPVSFITNHILKKVIEHLP